MTNYERIKAMSIKEMATAIYNGISSDGCDYCVQINGPCNGSFCRHKSGAEIVADWLESEAEQ